MKLTNKFNVPPTILSAIQVDIDNDPYIRTEGEIGFRTTELLGPPLPVTLWNKYKDSDELVVDATHYLAVQYGKMFHSMCEGEIGFVRAMILFLEKHLPVSLLKVVDFLEEFCQKLMTPDRLYEYKVKRTFDFNGQKVIVYGTLDELEFIDNSLLFTDNKTCLMSNLGYDKPEYDEQLNTYLHLLRADYKDLPSSAKMRLRYFIKDWTPSKKLNALARAANPYTKNKAELMPDSSIFYKEVPVYDEVDIDRIITNHINDHLENPERVCTASERWDTLPKIAVMLTGNKTAKKICVTKEEAQQYIATKLNEKDQKRSYTEERMPGAHERDKRCQLYCQVKSVCPYAKEKGY